MTWALRLALALVVSCGSSERKPKVHAVAIRAMQFEPAHIDVHIGDTVVWTNEDVVPHTATATGSFDSQELAAKQQWRYTVTKAGDIAYTCTYHPTMRGALLVKPDR